MKVINFLEWDISYPRYSEWYRNNNIPVMRISMMKYRMREEDFVFFKLSFNKTQWKSFSFDDED